MPRWDVYSLREWDKYWRISLLNEVQPSFTKSGKRIRKVKWICDCWKIKIYSLHKLRSWHTKSCGCYRKENITTHWLSSHRVYETRRKMIDRCDNINASNYKYYWWRWISVCSRRYMLENFIEDMGMCSWKKITIERINVDWDYTPENCRRATKSEQTRNKTNTVSYNWKCMSERAFELWTYPQLFRHKLHNYWWDGAINYFMWKKSSND